MAGRPMEHDGRDGRDGSAWREAQLPDGLPVEGRVVYWGYFGPCTVLVADEQHQEGTVRHASISHPWRDPTWEEIRAVRRRFWPEQAECVAFIPTAQEAVVFGLHIVHLWGDPEGVRRWGLRDE